MIDLSGFTHLTFDCYGTLIDWETGILNTIHPVLSAHGITAPPEKVLRLYSRLEAEQESGPYRSYREVLRGVMAGLGGELGFRPSASELEALADSIATWQPFPDTIDALRRLQARCKLVIVSNIDDALFAGTAKLLGMTFDDVITAEQVGSYKPSMNNFRFALARMGVPASQVLHVAQSLFHDHVPARALGLSTAWINRPSRLEGTGLALPASAEPSLKLPDLRSLAEHLEKSHGGGG